MKVAHLVGKGIAVHCDTKDKAIKFLKEVKKIFPNDDYENSNWKTYGDRTCYRLCDISRSWRFCSIEEYREWDYKIIELEELEEFAQ